MRNSAHLHLIDNITVKYCLTNFFLQKNQFFFKKNAIFSVFPPEQPFKRPFRGIGSVHLFAFHPDFADFKFFVQHCQIGTITRLNFAHFTQTQTAGLIVTGGLDKLRQR